MGKLFNGLIRKCLVGVGAAVLVFASMGANAGIAGSKHDLTNSGTGSNRVSTGSPEICVFCHTPHGSSSAAPLWNKVLPATMTYTPYASSTLDGTPVSGGVSLACLSCHDGSQAMDTMINRPGSGNYDNVTGARAYAGETWVGSAANSNGLMAAGVFNLGTDLTNDHPIEIPFCGGGMTVTAGVVNMSGCLDPDFKTPVGNLTGAQKVWFETGAGGANGSKNKDDIQLYNRGGGGVFYVECGSCHDPHNAGAGTPATFLRVSNAGSAVCLACHNK